jgi:hypothetical protein
MSTNSSLSATTLVQSDSVSPVPNSKIVYVVVANRKNFDQIDRPVTEHPPLPDGRRCLSKDIGNWSMASNDGLVIFQHWIAPATTQPADGVSA